MALVENLQKDVHDIRVRLLDLVEQQHAVRLAADLLGDLAGLIVADVAGRRTDDARNAVLFHEFAHVQANQRLRLIEQLFGQDFHEFRLADARRADEDKRRRAAAGADLDAAAADGRGNGRDGLLLADDAAV